MTTPTATPEYTRRVIAPTATAEQLAERLAAVLIDIRATYTPLVEASTVTVKTGTGFDVAEQVVADLEQIYTITHELLRADVGVKGADGLGDLLLGLVPAEEV